MKASSFYFPFIILLFITNLIFGQCEVSFTSHSENAKINKSPFIISGTAKVPANSHVWVLVQVVGRGGWVPQGNGEVFIEDDSTWDCEVYLGNTGDTGYYRIAIAVVNDKVNESLNNWVARSRETREYPEIDFPSVIDGYSIKKIRLEKR